jgi:hypothetical protein
VTFAELLDLAIKPGETLQQIGALGFGASMTCCMRDT